MDIMHAIFHRRSIRKFTDQPVEKEKIELMLRAAMAAPSACNQQPWEYYVITGEENVKRLCACSPYAKFALNAPVMFCASSRHRKTAMAATSSGWTNFLVGWRARRTSFITCSRVRPRLFIVSGIWFSTSGVQT